MAVQLTMQDGQPQPTSSHILTNEPANEAHNKLANPRNHEQTPKDAAAHRCCQRLQ